MHANGLTELAERYERISCNDPVRKEIDQDEALNGLEVRSFYRGFAAGITKAFAVVEKHTVIPVEGQKVIFGYAARAGSLAAPLGSVLELMNPQADELTREFVRMVGHEPDPILWPHMIMSVARTRSGSIKGHTFVLSWLHEPGGYRVTIQGSRGALEAL